MPSKLHRLRKKKDFELVFKKGRGFKKDFLVLKLAENKLEESRLGFIVGGKVSKNAAVRNKIKRRLKEITRKKSGSIKRGIDLVLIAQPGLEKRSFHEIEDIINQLFKKARII
jgi:ribonuclease P protein component